MHKTTTPKPVSKPRFISLRWRFMTPLFFVVLVVSMIGAYIVARNLSGGLEVSQTNILLRNTRTVADRAAQLAQYHYQEAQRIAFTNGVSSAILSRQPEKLESILKSLASVNKLDSLIVTDSDGSEILGILRVASGSDFALSTNTFLGEQFLVRDVLDGQQANSRAFMATSEGVLLYTAVPVYSEGAVVGAALVGQRLGTVLADLKSSTVADLTLYGPEGEFLQTTFPDTIAQYPLTLDRAVFSQALTAQDAIPIVELFIGQDLYQSAVQPFRFGSGTLGAMGVFMPDHVPFITAAGRQLTALLAAALAGAVVTVAFAGITRFTRRIEHVTAVAGTLASGARLSRTTMQPTDEIGAAGHALDRYAASVQERQDALRAELRRQRREIAHFVRVLETIPDGVVVQDSEGRVVLMNDRARELLGSQRVFRSTGLHELADVVGQQLGTALAPGLYALGNPHRLNLDDRMLSAQAAAIVSVAEYRMGTVILLRDITEIVLRERQHDIFLNQMAASIQRPLAKIGRMGLLSESGMVNAFAREITRQAVALQKMIADMRDLTLADPASVQRRQRALHLETLVWAIANEWRQIAQANGLTMHISIAQTGLFVLADERRIRWAVGNIIDNAIKYTPQGGALSLEIQGENDGMASLRVRDNGVGISHEERPFVFTRFYRGTPTTADGHVIRIPGIGQGLYIARQILESHGGNIYMKTSQKVGTAVYMSLPLTAPVGLELPRIPLHLEGETVQLPDDFVMQLEQVHIENPIHPPKERL